jgi:hypothetical protein
MGDSTLHDDGSVVSILDGPIRWFGFWLGWWD